MCGPSRLCSRACQLSSSSCQMNGSLQPGKSACQQLSSCQTGLIKAKPCCALSIGPRRKLCLSWTSAWQRMAPCTRPVCRIGTDMPSTAHSQQCTIFCDPDAWILPVPIWSDWARHPRTVRRAGYRHCRCLWVARIVANVAAAGDTVGTTARPETSKVACDSDEHEITIRCPDDVRLVREWWQHRLLLHVRPRCSAG